MQVSEVAATGEETRASRVRWAAVAAWTLAILTPLTLVSLLFTFGVVEAGSPLAVVGNVGTPLSFLLVSVLGILLWLAGANRWAAGLLVVLFPVGIIFGMLQAVLALTPLVGLIPLLALIVLGVDLRQKAGVAGRGA